MKKLLTILLTLVMAVCLVNLNYNHTKAEENYDYEIVWNGSSWSPDPATLPATYNANKTYKITNSSNNSIDIIDNGISSSLGKNAFRQSKFNNNGATLILDSDTNHPTAIITDVVDGDPVPCPGITFDEGNWKSQKTVLTLAQLENTYGIRYDNSTVTATLTKNLIMPAGGELVQGSVLRILTSSSIDTFNIELEDDIQIECMYPTTTMVLYLDATSGSPTFNINGNGHTLNLVSHNVGSVFYNAYTVNLNDVKADIITDITTSPYETVNFSGQVVLNKNSELKVTNKSTTTGYAIVDNAQTTIHSTCDVLGTADGSKEEANLKAAVRDTDDGIYKVNTGTEASPIWKNAKYIKITPKPVTPTPSPSPSKKDESCEKVIGPTWHWNNSKGICEDYGVVGTSTR